MVESISRIGNFALPELSAGRLWFFNCPVRSQPEFLVDDVDSSSVTRSNSPGSATFSGGRRISGGGEGSSSAVNHGKRALGLAGSVSVEGTGRALSFMFSALYDALRQVRPPKVLKWIAVAANHVPDCLDQRYLRLTIKIAPLRSILEELGLLHERYVLSLNHRIPC